MDLQQQLLDLKVEIGLYDEKKMVIVTRKRNIENELSDLNSRVRHNGKRLPSSEFNSILRRQRQCKQIKGGLEDELSEIKQTKRDLSIEGQDIRIKLRAEKKRTKEQNPCGTLRTQVYDIRDSFLDFSIDQTRVSSMRLMAADIAGQLTKALDATIE